MKRALLVLLLASGCLDFERRVATCFDGGVCTTTPDAGTTSPVDGGFCTGVWCWESPLPHGVKLNAVYADGDDLVVAGDFGMLAERRGGQWRSFQPSGTPRRSWLNVWGRSMNDVWLVGGGEPWHRTATGWASEGADLTQSWGVTGDADAVYVSSGNEVRRHDTGGWSSFTSVPQGRVFGLTFAFGALHGAVLTTTSAGAVTNLSTMAQWSFASGAYTHVYGTTTALYAAGEASVELDGALQARQLTDPLRAVVETNGRVFGVSSSGVGSVVDGGVKVERAARGLTAMAAGANVVAVGDNGLILERRSGQWTDPTPTVTRRDVVAFVERSGRLLALTDGCELLEREAQGWAWKAQANAQACVDAVVDGDSVVVLTQTGLVHWLEGPSLAAVTTDALSPGLGVHLWRSDSGALVATSTTDVFVRQPGGTFAALPALANAGSSAVAGRGSVARVCGLSQDRVAELDLSTAPPTVTVVPGLTVNGCRALISLRDGGWAFGARGGGMLPHVLLVDANGTQRDVTVELADAWVEALLETGQGLVVATTGGVVLLPQSPPARVKPPDLGFAPVLKALTSKNGRLYVGGAGGAILQRPAPE